MKLAALAIALNAAFAAAEFKMPNFRGSGPAILADIEVEGNGIQPEYCDGAPNNPETTDDNNHNGLTPDEDCWPSNDGYPKCCSKNKGTCPYGTPPQCEDGSDPDGGDNNRDGRCMATDDCVSDQFCKFNIANCGNQGEGRCTDIPGDTACTMHLDYVCGCDGKTYSNECVADAQAVSIKHFGECEIIDCNANSDCNNDEYCQWNLGNCGAQKEGICMDIPGLQACPMNYSPVCGCDDKTYSNECEAQAQGKSLKYYGECETVDCRDNNDCSSSKYCAFEQGICGHSDGVCVEKPKDTVCTANYHPVCGCNGKTYGNSCEASAAAVSIKYWGEC